jgi:hypothetical protein
VSKFCGPLDADLNVKTSAIGVSNVQPQTAAAHATKTASAAAKRERGMKFRPKGEGFIESRREGGKSTSSGGFCQFEPILARCQSNSRSL